MYVVPSLFASSPPSSSYFFSFFLVSSTPPVSTRVASPHSYISLEALFSASFDPLCLLVHPHPLAPSRDITVIGWCSHIPVYIQRLVRIGDWQLRSVTMCFCVVFLPQL